MDSQYNQIEAEFIINIAVELGRCMTAHLSRGFPGNSGLYNQIAVSDHPELFVNYLRKIRESDDRFKGFCNRALEQIARDSGNDSFKP